MSEAKQPKRSIPWAVVIAFLALAVGSGLICFGVLLLAGAGWATLAASIPFFLVSMVIFRGLRHAD